MLLSAIMLVCDTNGVDEGAAIGMLYFYEVI